MAKLTIKELLAKKEEMKSRKVQEADLYIESLDAEITIIAPLQTLILEAQEESEKDNSRGDEYIVFHCVKEPYLKDKALQEAYGCAEPLDIVSKIFLPGEISGIASEIIKLAGFGTGISKVGKAIKN